MAKQDQVCTPDVHIRIYDDQECTPQCHVHIKADEDQEYTPHVNIKADEHQVCTSDVHAEIYEDQGRTSHVHIVRRDVLMRPNERANIARCSPDECVRAHGLTREEGGDVPMEPTKRANTARCAPDEYVSMNREVPGDANFVCHRTERYVLVKFCESFEEMTSTIRVLGERLGGPAPTMTFMDIYPFIIDVDCTADKSHFRS